MGRVGNVSDNIWGMGWEVRYPITSGGLEVGGEVSDNIWGIGGEVSGNIWGIWNGSRA